MAISPRSIEEHLFFISYYREKVRYLIRAKRQMDAAGLVNPIWRPEAVGSWFRQYRLAQQDLRQALQAQAGV